ncbi:MAG: macro domain-containing protein [Candidatus Omnitrophica bacterium]|nr:macro domain-containing protein [Candidatus Omnitrophota bacterium]
MKLGDTEVIVVKGDIVKADTEAIVNAANNEFCMGGGVAGAIKRAGGEIIEQEAMSKGPVNLGEAIITSAGSLKAKYVVHAVTMKMDFKTDEEIIRKATHSSLICAQENKISSIAFCALGCGVGRFSLQAASKIMAQEVFRYLWQIKEPILKKIIFVLNSDKAFGVFQKNVINYLEYISGKISAGPFLTVDGIIEYGQGIVMIERSNPPLGWALPGGFVDYGESVEEAVAREIKEETSLDFLNFKQFKVYSRPDRDPRFHTASVVFIGEGKGSLKADSDAKGVGVFKLDSLPEKIAFDHRKVIEDYIQSRTK